MALCQGPIADYMKWLYTYLFTTVMWSIDIYSHFFVGLLFNLGVKTAAIAILNDIHTVSANVSTHSFERHCIGKGWRPADWSRSISGICTARGRFPIQNKPNLFHKMI